MYTVYFTYTGNVADVANYVVIECVGAVKFTTYFVLFVPWSWVALFSGMTSKLKQLQL